jgi:hypothetical protein
VRENFGPELLLHLRVQSSCRNLHLIATDTSSNRSSQQNYYLASAQGTKHPSSTFETMTRRRQPRNIATEFDAYFGSGDLEDWQRLCHDVGLTGQFRSKTECRKVSMHATCFGRDNAVRNPAKLTKITALHGIPAGPRNSPRQHLGLTRRRQARASTPPVRQRQTTR